MMKRFAYLAGALTLLAGCEAAEFLADAEPSISNVTGPAGSASDLDYKGTTATANVTVFPDAEILLRKASTEAALRSPNAIDVPIDCTGADSVKACSGVLAETPFDTSQPVLGDSGTTFYQWFIEYGEAGGVAEGPVRSFTLAPAPSCAFEDVGGGLGAGDCAADQTCSQVSVSFLGTPGAETVPRCHIPAP